VWGVSGKRMRELVSAKTAGGGGGLCHFGKWKGGPSCKVRRGWVHKGLCNLEKVKRKLTEGTGENFSYKIDEQVAYAKIVQEYS
jgi:hypothetical protein